jgi:2,3-bisphosphoglycerate-dependent phosphoglycerate mutase
MSKLVLIRHGQSLWNLDNKFTGWVDIDLSDQGIQEAEAAGKKLASLGLKFSAVYTSDLTRAKRTYEIIKPYIAEPYIAEHEYEHEYEIPSKSTWRLNERHYGALQGLNKDETVKKYGAEQVRVWRRSYSTRPPVLTDNTHQNEQNIVGESLKDTLERVMPFWISDISVALRPGPNQGSDVLVVAHGNSLRALIKYLDNMSDQDIVELDIPTGIPLVYELDKDLRPVTKYYL